MIFRTYKDIIKLCHEGEKLDKLKSGAISAGKYFRTFYRWVLLAIVTGLVCGLVGSAFHMTVEYVTDFRARYPWLVFLLPAGGLAIALLYRVTRMEGEGTNNIIDSIHNGEKVPILLIPVIFIATAITHLFGGSAGREGAALQIGGGIGYHVGRLLRLDDKDMRLVTLCGMSAVFAALFGTPLTATIFALEVISVGILYYSGLIPCMVASVTAYAVSLLFGIEPMRYTVELLPLQLGMSLRVCGLAVVCALVSIVFCVAMHRTEHFAKSRIKNIYLRVFLGGLIIIGLTLVIGNESYNGTGTDIISSALGEGKAPTWGFLWKIIFTAVTIGFGFKGGEIVPTMFIGATLGCVFGPILGIPAQFAAAIALVAVFCGAVNCPIASIILSVELFGSGELLYFALACGISYMLSGYFGLYSSQKIMYSKTRAEFINRYAR